MKTERWVIDLPEVIKLVEGAIKKLAMHKEDANAVANLNKLQGEVTIMLEILAPDQRAIL